MSRKPRLLWKPTIDMTGKLSRSRDREGSLIQIVLLVASLDQPSRSNSSKWQQGAVGLDLRMRCLQMRSKTELNSNNKLAVFTPNLTSMHLTVIPAMTMMKLWETVICLVKKKENWACLKLRWLKLVPCLRKWVRLLSKWIWKEQLLPKVWPSLRQRHQKDKMMVSVRHSTKWVINRRKCEHCLHFQQKTKISLSQPNI